MARFLFTFAAVLSLLVCVGALVLWGRSYRVGDYVQVFRPWTQNGQAYGTSRYFWSARGTLGLNTVVFQDSRAYQVTRLRWDRVTDRSWVPWGGFLATKYGIGFDRGSNRFLIPYRKQNVWEVAVRYWLIAAIAAILPLARLAAWHRGWPQPGRCRTCGYDLRASPNRCPECGSAAVIARRTADSP